MELYIGGFGQGKVTYVIDKYKDKNVRLLDAGAYDDPGNIDDPEDILEFDLIQRKTTDIFINVFRR